MINLTDKLAPDQLGWARGIGVPITRKVPHVDRLFKNTPQQQIRHIFLLVTPKIAGRDS
jgi:hypothetical protein